MLKKTFSLILSLLVLNLFVLSKFVVYADTSSSVLSLTDKFNVLQGIHNNLNTSVPTSLIYGKALRYAEELGQIQHSIAEEEYNSLSDTEKLNYKSVRGYFLSNYSSIAIKAMDRYDTVLKDRGIVDKELLKYLNDFSTKAKDIYLKIPDAIYEGLNADNETEILNKKIRLQVDTSFINKSIDYNLKSDTSSSVPYFLRSSVVDNVTNASSLSYSDSYIASISEKERADFLYNFCDKLRFDMPLKPFVVVISSREYNILDNAGFLSSQMSMHYYVDDKYLRQNHIFYSSLFYGNLRENSSYYLVISDMFNLSSKYNFNYDYIKTMKKFPDVAGSLEDEQALYQRFLNSHFVHDDFYHILYAVRTPSDRDYELNINYGMPLSSFTSDDTVNKTYIPKSIVSMTITLPFENNEDVSKFRTNYLLYQYEQENRPINFIITLGDVLKGNYKNAVPATKELVADLPIVNTTDLPLTDTSSLPSNEDIEKEKEKEKNGLVIPGTTPGTVPGVVNPGIDGLKTKDEILDFIKSLVVPDTSFFEKYYNDLKNGFPKSVNPLLYKDFFLQQSNNIGVHIFQDYYIDILGQNVKVVDMTPFRTMYPKVKEYTNFFFWFLLLLYNYNQVYFLIRGVKPLSSGLFRSND